MDPLARVGEPAPDFVLHDLEGQLCSLADQRGRILVLNFWSVDCPHSERTDRILSSLLPAWGGQVSVWWLASNANEPDEQLKLAAHQRQAGPVLRDEGQVIADRYGAQTTPHLFVVDAGGVLRYAGAPDDVGFRQRLPTRRYLADAVQALLEGRAPEPESTPPFGCALVRVPDAPRPPFNP
jgi:peroxiredoxin